MDQVRRLNHRLAQSPFLSDPVWPLSPLAYDTFTRGDGAIGSTELAGPNAEVISAFAWTVVYGTWVVSSNKAVATALESGVLASATIPTTLVNYDVQANLYHVDGVGGVYIRCASTSNLVRAVHDGTNVLLTKRIANVNTNVISEVVAYSDGAIIKATCQGTLFKVYYDDVLIGSATIADAAVQTGTPGLYTTNVGNSFDNFLIYPRNSYNYF